MIRHLILLSSVFLVSQSQSYTPAQTSTAATITTSPTVVPNPSQLISQCAVPEFRVIGIPLPGELQQDANGNWVGFIVDLLNAMGTVGGFTYKFTSFTDKPGSVSNGCSNGAIAEIAHSGTADIIALVVNSASREDILDMTTSVFESKLQLVYNTKFGINSDTYYAVEANSTNYDFLRDSANPDAQAIFQKILQYAPTSLPTSTAGTISLVQSGNWAAFLPSQVSAPAICASNGALALDSRVWRRILKSFGVQAGTALRSKLNKLILSLSDQGVIDYLFSKWFSCPAVNG